MASNWRAALGKTVWTELDRRERRQRVVWLCLLSVPVWIACVIAMQMLLGVALIWIPVACQAIVFDVMLSQRISHPADGNPRFIFVLVLIDVVVVAASFAIVFALSGQ